MDKDQIYLIQGLFILTSLFDISWFFNGIEEIVNLLDNSSISYFEYSTADGHIKIDKSLSRAQQSGKVKVQERKCNLQRYRLY